MSGAPTSPYSADALAANQAGQLTDQQRQALRGRDKGMRKTELYLAIGAAIIGVLLITSSGPSPEAWLRPFAAIAAFVIAGGLLVRSLFAGDSLSSDLASGSIQTVEGAVLKDVRQGKQTESFYLHVAGLTFDVPRSLYLAAPDAGIIRVYYLPRSKTVVNLEHLADRPLPAGAAAAPAAIAQEALASFGSHDLNQRAEAIAQMAALKSSIEAGSKAAAVEPPASALDPRPLAEAIVGTWQAGPIGVTFLADGTMTTHLPGGHSQPGRWSVTADGELHAQFAGRDQAGKAWVAGDTLTLSEDGQGRQLQRVAQA
jgi:hypothetical protein